MIAGAFSTYRASYYAMPHCLCQCMPEMMRFGEMSDVVALHAPRPVLLINGIEDKIFPIDAARQGYKKLQQVYQVLGAQENIDADFFQGGHRWSNNKSLAFLKQHFGE
jgi:predicted esterase